MILFCPACGDELEGFDPRYSKEWPRHCGEQMVQLREDDPTPIKKLRVAGLDISNAPVEHLPSDDPGVMIVQVPDKWYLEPDDSQGAAERIGKRLASEWWDQVMAANLTAAYWAALDREMGGAIKQATLVQIADQINAMIDGRVTHATEAINLQQLSREMERTDG